MVLWRSTRHGPREAHSKQAKGLAVTTMAAGSHGCESRGQEISKKEPRDRKVILPYYSSPPKTNRNLWSFHYFRMFFSLFSVLFFVGGLPYITIGYKWLEPSFGWIPLWHSIGDWDWLSRHLYRACIPFQHTRWLNSRCDCLSLKPSKLCPAIQQTGCLKIQWSVKGLIFLMKLQLGGTLWYAML